MGLRFKGKNVESGRNKGMNFIWHKILYNRIEHMIQFPLENERGEIGRMGDIDGVPNLLCRILP